MKTVLIIAAFVLIAAGCAVIEGSRAEGVFFEGSAMGFRGLITVQVRINGGSIMEITVVESKEDRFVGGAAIEELIDKVIENDSADVDAVSGATVTSKGFLEAVNRAILRHE